jgi:hypothetical protein
MSPPVILSCSPADDNRANVTVPWTVPRPGTYMLAITARYWSEAGQLAETLHVFVLSVRHAPTLAKTGLRRSLPRRHNTGLGRAA